MALTPTFDITSDDLARLFSSQDIKQATIEIVIDKLIEHAIDSEMPVPAKAISKAFRKLGIAFDPLDMLESVQITRPSGDDGIELHPIVSDELNLWPHLLSILRNKFGFTVSKRMHDIGRYLKYLDTLSSQLSFLVLNFTNVDKEIMLNAVKGLFTIRLVKNEALMSLEDALRFYKYKEDVSSKALTALRTLGENMHLLTNKDMMHLRKSMISLDSVASQAEAVKHEFTKFSVDAFLSGIVSFDDIIEYENMDELITLSLLMRAEKGDAPSFFQVKDTDPVSRLIQKYLSRELPENRREAVLRLLSSFFRELFAKEGLNRDLDKVISSLHHKEIDLKATFFKTIKKMHIWTPIYRQRIKASSRNLILVNDLSGSMIASYIGQIQLFQGLARAIEGTSMSEIVFMSFSSDTFAVTQSRLATMDNSKHLLDILTRSTMGMTDLNAALHTLKTGKPARGDTFTPPDPEESIIYFISDLQETAGGSVDWELAESVVGSAHKFFISVPSGAFNSENYLEFSRLGAILVQYDSVTEIPVKILDMVSKEIAT